MAGRANRDRLRRAAFTLAEVLAALAVVATLLVGLLVSLAGARRQVARARELAEAAETARSAIGQAVAERWYGSLPVQADRSVEITDTVCTEYGLAGWRKLTFSVRVGTGSGRGEGPVRVWTLRVPPNAR